MSKKFLLTSLFVSSVFGVDYISSNNYIQNPFNGQPSKGGTQMVTESQMATQSVWERWFTDGTYNIQGNGSYVSLNDKNYFAYGANAFAQTGTVAGFSFGGNLVVVNPAFSNVINNNADMNSMQFLPSTQVNTVNELFVEYKIHNTVQADVGWLYINTPWLSSSDSLALQQPTYQGALVNVQLAQELMLTGLAINGYMPISSNYFSGATLYDQNWDYGTAFPNINNAPSTGTYAAGLVYGADGPWKTQIWGYMFQQYGNLLYADSKYTLAITGTSNISFAVQGGVQGSDSGNVMAAAGYGAPTANIVGAQVAYAYNWFGLSASYNQVWGGTGSYENGGIVSPYTYQLATDPLYTTAVLAGLVEKSAGSAYKISPQLNLLEGAISIAPSYASYVTAAVPNSEEWDLNITYTPSFVKGLTISGVGGYLIQPYVEGVSGGNTQFVQGMVSYLY